MPELIIDRVKLRYLREGLGWTQQDLADRSKVQRSTISKIETGERSNIRTSTLKRLAAALGVSTDELLISSPVTSLTESSDSYQLAMVSIQRSLQDLDEPELEQIREYLAFIRSRRKSHDLQ